MLSTLIADDDFPDDEDLCGGDPNAETVIMKALGDPEEPPPARSLLATKDIEDHVLPGHIANRRLMRLEQGAYDPRHPNFRQHL